MADPQTPQSPGFVQVVFFILNGLLTILGAFGTWLLNDFRQRINGITKSQQKLATEQQAMAIHHSACVTRDELDKKFEVLRDDRQRMHQENLDSIRELRTTIVTSNNQTSEQVRDVHSRIDELMRERRR